MSKSFEVQGVIHSIGETQAFGQNGFTKREFVIKLSGEGENPAYPSYVALELLKDKCALMDQYQLGQEIIAHFNLSGRLWAAQGKPEKCFTSLQAWRIESPETTFGGSAADGGNVGGNNFNIADFSPSSNNFDDDVPF
ncbi:MAG: hypothetical protein ACI9EX_000682 [Oleispira sp.]|jgi:hypothetical protein